MLLLGWFGFVSSCWFGVVFLFCLVVWFFFLNPDLFSVRFFGGFCLLLFLPVKQTNLFPEQASTQQFVFCPKNSTIHGKTAGAKHGGRYQNLP